MSRRARKQVRVVAVIVRPCSWKQTSAVNFKLLPKDGVAPERWSSTDAAYVNVAEGIGEVIDGVRRELTTAQRGLRRAASVSGQKSKPKLKPAKGHPVTARRSREVSSTSSGIPRKRSRRAPAKR
jgi:hypothetical protein